MNQSAVLLDVNVPMYAAGRPHPNREACAWVMAEVAEGRLAAAIDAETIQEILHRYGATGQWQVAVTLATNLCEVVPMVYPVLLADARLAIELFQRYAPHGVKARDLLHAAVLLNNRLSAIVSTDRHFDLIEGITRLDPQELFRQGRKFSS